MSSFALRLRLGKRLKQLRVEPKLLTVLYFANKEKNPLN